MVNRERNVDIKKLTKEEIDILSVQIGDKIREITDEAVEKANRFLHVYGMNAKMQIVLEHKDLVEAPKKRRGRPKKSNL